MHTKKKVIIILLIAVLFMGFCMSCSKKRPRRSSSNGKCGSGMVWMPDHYDPSGNWIPGQCIHK